MKQAFVFVKMTGFLLPIKTNVVIFSTLLQTATQLFASISTFQKVPDPLESDTKFGEDIFCPTL